MLPLTLGLVRALRGVSDAAAYFVEQCLSLGDQLLAADFVKDLVAEGSAVEHRPHLSHDLVAFRGPVKYLIG